MNAASTALSSSYYDLPLWTTSRHTSPTTSLVFQEGFSGGRPFKADHLLKILRALGRLMTPVNGPNHLLAIEWSGMDMVNPENPDDINGLSIC